ncbi:MAG: hypothetical protein CBB95_07735 [Alteromonas sp. TMED35]|jgi:hypothetical protein|uniref:DUF3150 domain-containing protein n=1 Tax=uncultured Alteromonas sp. TaxID=179113 RepID=UPI000B651B3D|nr:MAG: hypothetical protein CBB95_17430 [Alteromonas sp. TMED35]OUX87980.1 MAG: hypothetical protein CBB95_07735 [Alteromonas sp. TMED35]|tara:strand:+ start:23941 stop:25029 length:1089 start_codon:yes stop_codon:yes gene_type:complete
MYNKINIEGAVLVSVSFTGCGGSMVLSDGSIMVDDVAIDTQGYTKKALQWFPTNALAFKDKYTKRVRRYLENIGIKTPLGIVVGEHALPEVETFIENAKSAFMEEVDEVCANYDLIIDRHAREAVAKNGSDKIGKIINAVKLTRQQFRDTFKVVSMPPVSLSTSSDEEAEEIRAMLSDNALKALVEDASHLFKKSYRGRESVTKAATAATFELQEKFYNLSFSDPNLSVVAEQFADLLDGVSIDEQSGQTFHAMYRFVKELSEETSLLDLMKGEKSGDGEDDTDAAQDTNVTALSSEGDNSNVVSTVSNADTSTDEEAETSTTSDTSAEAEVEQDVEDTVQTHTEDEEPEVMPQRINGFGNF